MSYKATRRSQGFSARARREKNRRSMIIMAVAAVLLLIGTYFVQQRLTQPPIVQTISDGESASILLPLGNPVKPLSGGHDMSKIPSSLPQPEIVEADASVPKVQVPEDKHDFGEIPPSPPVAYVYAIQNTGTVDLQLRNLVTSCGCTKAELSTSIIPPGHRADLKVVFDPGFHETVGPVTRLVWMMTNDPTQPWLEVTLTADVLPAP
ncbi:MAG: DUF1573 domain-containing protein [Anaerolineae bacterium]|nr:DUF1573 domain-containing protein [Anaerolineae bacterium]